MLVSIINSCVVAHQFAIGKSVIGCMIPLSVTNPLSLPMLCRVMERLRLAETFLPAFQDVVCELQCHFGVTSLGALVPTLCARRQHMSS